MSFIQKLFRLCTDLTIYREIAIQKTKIALGFFTLFYLCYSLLFGIYFKINFAPQFIASLESAQKTIIESIPDQAKLTIESGKLTATGINIPFTLMNSVTFDTTAVKITAPESEAMVINYKDAEISGSLTGAEIHNASRTALETIKSWLPYAALILAAPMFFGLWLGRLLNVAIYTAIFSLGNMLFGQHHTFRSFFNLTLHTVVIAELINVMILLVYGQSYPIIFPVAFFGVTTLAYLNLPVEPKRSNDQAI